MIDRFAQRGMMSRPTGRRLVRSAVRSWSLLFRCYRSLGLVDAAAWAVSHAVQCRRGVGSVRWLDGSLVELAGAVRRLGRLAASGRVGLILGRQSESSRLLVARVAPVESARVGDRLSGDSWGDGRFVSSSLGRRLVRSLMRSLAFLHRLYVVRGFPDSAAWALLRAVACRSESAAVPWLHGALVRSAVSAWRAGADGGVSVSVLLVPFGGGSAGGCVLSSASFVAEGFGRAVLVPGAVRFGALVRVAGCSFWVAFQWIDSASSGVLRGVGGLSVLPPVLGPSLGAGSRDRAASELEDWSSCGRLAVVRV